MRFNLSLHTSLRNAILPANYQYPLAAAIYKIISRADESYSIFLHGQGYRVQNSLKGFKLFTFSDIRTPFRIQGDRLAMTTQSAAVKIAFHLPDTAEHFIRGLFMDQRIDIADRLSKVSFQVQQVESESLWPEGISVNSSGMTACLEPLSLLVIGRKNDQGHYDFLSPQMPDFTYWLLYNWKEKYRAVYPDESTEAIFHKVQIEVLPGTRPPRSRLIRIKADTAEQTKIKGYNSFRMQVKAPAKVLELALNAGLGQYNSLGMGYIRIRV